jgi:predicted XRE-type DNA-binding protein
LKLKQSNYKEVLEVNRNYNKIFRSDKIHKNVEAFNDDKLVGGATKVSKELALRWRTT